MSAFAHADAFAALPELALDALDGRERDDVLDHVRSCIVCRRELDELRETTAALGEAVAPVEFTAARCDPMRERLVQRAAADRSASSGVSGATRADRTARTAANTPPTRSAWLAAAGLLFAVSLGATAWMARDRSSALTQAESAERRLAQAETALNERDRQLAERSAMISALTGPSVAVINLAASGSRDPIARMFWDRATNRWTMIGHNLPQPQPGRTYQLWLVTANERISAGTFKPGANGDALVQATYALPANALKAIAVTDEPAAGVAQPTGPIVISGAAN